MHWSFFVCFWFIHDLATLHSTCCIQQRLVESWTLTKRICLMMKPSSLVVHDDIFILNLVPPIVNYPKRSRFLRTLCFCKTNLIARSICNLTINHFLQETIPLIHSSIELTGPTVASYWRCCTVWSLEWERFM